MPLNLNNNTVTNDSSDSVGLSTVPCAVSSYISVMESYNKTVDVETGIKETHTVNNVTSVDGLVNALINQGLNCSVIKTNSMKDLIALYNVSNANIITHLFIDNQYHYGHIKDIKKDGILFNDNWFVPYHLFKKWYTGITIIISNVGQLNFNSFGEHVNKSEWVNITGKLTQRELFNYNYGLISNAINLNNKYVKLKANLNDNDKKGFDFAEHVLFGDTLKPKIANLVKIQGQLNPIYNNLNAPNKLLVDLNNILVPMQTNLNDTIGHLNYLIKMINECCINNDDNLKSSNVGGNPIKQVDVPKLLGDGCNLFINNLKESINNLNPLNAHPELRERLDQKYGLEHHKFGFIDYYTHKK